MELRNILNSFLSNNSIKTINTESLYNIIKEYQNDAGFIMNIDCINTDLQEFLNTSEIIALLKIIQEYNISLHNQYESELKSIEGKGNLSNIEEKHVINLEKKEVNTKSVPTSSYSDVTLSSYADMIMDDNTEDIIPIISCISDEKDFNYIKLKLLELIVTYKKELLTQISDEDKIYYKEQIEILEDKMNTIISYQNSLGKPIISKKTFHLIFINDDDRNIFYDELKQIDPKYYEAIYNLLSIIMSGDNNRFKSFTNNDKFNGLLEVRDLYNKLRVVFKFFHNYCVIISTFHKDCDNSTIYRSRLLNKINIFEANAPKIEAQLKEDPSVYLELEEEILQYLTTESKKKVKN